MPFTFAHPAIVLPLHKFNIQYSSTALIIGSLTPDFEFIFQLKESTTFGHTPLGIFILDIPMALLLCYSYHLFIRNNAIAHLPMYFKKRLMVFTSLDWSLYVKKNWTIVLVSLLVGIFSHIAWDAFTHKDGWVVVQFPYLLTSFKFFSYPITWYNYFQLWSSILGLWYIMYYIHQLPITNYKLYSHTSSIKYWFTIFVWFLLLLLFRLWLMPNAIGFWDIVLAIMGCFIYALIILSMYYYFTNHSKKTKVL